MACPTRLPHSNENRYSAACTTPTVQQEIEKILLLAIADIEKVQKYYSNDLDIFNFKLKFFQLCRDYRKFNFV